MQTFDMDKFKKALGKRRCAKVSEFYDDGFVIEITLAANDHWEIWEYYAGEYTFSEIVFYAKRLIDEGERI